MSSREGRTGRTPHRSGALPQCLRGYTKQRRGRPGHASYFSQLFFLTKPVSLLGLCENLIVNEEKIVQEEISDITPTRRHFLIQIMKIKPSPDEPMVPIDPDAMFCTDNYVVPRRVRAS
jgi:hypothetical protein